MADDRHYVPGDFFRICDRTGFKVRASKTVKEWTGRIVRAESFEPRQPQDFVRGVRDDQFVPEPRPRQTDLDAGNGPAQFMVYGDNPSLQTFLISGGSFFVFRTGNISASSL